VIAATDDEAASRSSMTCGANPTYAEVVARIRWLEEDDAAVDTKGLN
jgi:hypothetical protein